MSLVFTSFANPGTIADERIVFKALTDLDVGKYAVLRSAVSSNGRDATSGWKSAYWFADEKVKANDLVVLYTKSGSRSTKDMGEGRTAFFFYWGMTEAIWGGKAHGVVLLEVNTWRFSLPTGEHQ